MWDATDWCCEPMTLSFSVVAQSKHRSSLRRGPRPPVGWSFPEQSDVERAKAIAWGDSDEAPSQVEVVRATAFGNMLPLLDLYPMALTPSSFREDVEGQQDTQLPRRRDLWEELCEGASGGVTIGDQWRRLVRS